MGEHAYRVVWSNGQWVSKPLLRFKDGKPLDDMTRAHALRNLLSQPYRWPADSLARQ